MKHPLCEGKIENKENGEKTDCTEMARWAITLRSHFNFGLLKGFACNDCRNRVERSLSAEGEKFGYNRVVVVQFR